MGKNLIEFACSHNNGRSPLAEGFGRQYLEALEVRKYDVISSGTHVNEIDAMLKGEIPFEEYILKFFLGKGLERNFFRGNVSEVEKIIKSLGPYDAVANAHALGVAEKLVAEEQGYKEQAFKKFGLGSPKVGRDQTVARDDSKIVLGMGIENVERIREMYKRRANPPTIETLAGFASMNSGQEFKEGFGGSFEDYLAMGEVIRGHVHGAIDRFLKIGDA